MAGTSLFQVGEDVEFWRVLAHLSILAVFLLILEYALHCAEHQLARYDKYYHTLQKVYRELMILGLISLVLKILKEVAPIDANSKPMIAFQVADLIIFGFAIALVIQAICIFLQVRNYCQRADRAELITTRSLAGKFQKQENSFNNSLSPKVVTSSVSPGISSNPTVIDKENTKHRLLRHFFLRRFGLPQLFPFSRYIRRAQANQISHVIEVEPSMWLLVLAVAWGICGLANILEGFKLVKILVASAWSLVLLHCLVLFYFRSSVRQLLTIAGYSEDKLVLSANLISVAEEEDSAWASETAEGALDTMNQVHELQEDIEQARQGFLRSDTGLQLASALCCKIRSSWSEKPSDMPRGPKDIYIRFFSQKVWHVVVTFLMAVNGFFVALFVQCALYNLDEIYEELGLIVAIMVPLPMMLNTLVLQRHIFSDFVLICSVLQLDANTLGDVTGHFSETVELQSAFAASLLQCMKEGGLTISYLEVVVQSHDLDRSGFIEIDRLHAVLVSVGFSLTRFRFISVVKLLFELKGTSLEYTQLFQLLSLVQHGVEQRPGYPEIQRSSTSFANEDTTHSISFCDLASSQQFNLLAQSSAASELGHCDFAFLRTCTPTLRQGSTLGLRDKQLNSRHSRRSMLQRSRTTQFTGSSSRMLHLMFNIRALAHFQDEAGWKDSTMV